MHSALATALLAQHLGTQVDCNTHDGIHVMAFTAIGFARGRRPCNKP
jgi:hypothetical protein